MSCILLLHACLVMPTRAFDTGKKAHRPAKSSWPTTFSPFSAPELQDAEVPYENLPVDKGHLLPIIHPQPGVSIRVPETLTLPPFAGSIPSFGPGSSQTPKNNSLSAKSPSQADEPPSQADQPRAKVNSASQGCVSQGMNVRHQGTSITSYTAALICSLSAWFYVLAHFKLNATPGNE